MVFRNGVAFYWRNISGGAPGLELRYLHRVDLGVVLDGSSLMLSFDLIAELTRITARVSLLVFCVAFVLDARTTSGRTERRAFGLFIITHFIHLGFVALYYVSLGAPPEFEPILVILGAGVLALLLIALRLFQAAGAPVTPWPIAWFLWMLFAGTHLLRLMDAERAGAINIALLSAALVAAAARLWVSRSN